MTLQLEIISQRQSLILKTYWALIVDSYKTQSYTLIYVQVCSIGTCNSTSEKMRGMQKMGQHPLSCWVHSSLPTNSATILNGQGYCWHCWYYYVFSFLPSQSIIILYFLEYFLLSSFIFFSLSLTFLSFILPWEKKKLQCKFILSDFQWRAN